MNVEVSDKIEEEQDTGEKAGYNFLNIITMKNQKLIALLSILFLTVFSSCSVIGDIFKAGMGVGIFLVVLVIGIIIYFVIRMGKSK